MAADHPNVLDDQARLSEHLQLLDQLGYSRLYGAGQHGNNLGGVWAPDCKAKIRVLDAIAVALTTGAPGEAFATAFDKRQGLTLVLAKILLSPSKTSRTRLTHGEEVLTLPSSGIIS